MIVVPDCDTHGALLFSVLAERSPCLQGDIDERAVASVLVEKVRARIVGDEEIGTPVAVEVAPRDTHTEPPARIGDTSFVRHVLERAISLVAIEGIARAV